MPSPSRAPGYLPPAQPEFFVQSPVSVVRCRTLPPVAKTTYEVLLSYRDKEHLARPGQTRLAAEVGVSEPTLRRALRLLATVGLIEPIRRGQGLTNCYRVHRSPLRTAERKECSVQNTQIARSRPNKTLGESDRIEQESDQRDQPPPNTLVGQGGGADTADLAQQIAADATLIRQATGMDAAEAQVVAHQAASQGQPPGYVAELVAHVTSSPNVQNPAGCLRALVQRGKRRPPRGAGGVPPRAQRAILHPEHYSTGGKYAHLFHRAPAVDVKWNTALSIPDASSSIPNSPLPPCNAQRIRGPSAFEVAANPSLAGRGAEAWPRGQPSIGS